jgi:hypothetical protein
MREKFFSIASPVFAPVFAKLLPQSYIRRLKNKSIIWGFSTQQYSLTDKIMMRLMRPYFQKEYYAKADTELRKVNREQYWGSEAGKLWHEEIRRKYSSPEAFQNEFLKRRETLTNMLDSFVKQFPGKYNTLCEIGTGNGLYIQYLFHKCQSSFDKWVGIDLNAEQIGINKELFKEIPIEFISMEVNDWVLNNKNTAPVFLTAGTLEYFTETELEEFFNNVKNSFRNAAIALIEPISFDLDTEQHSKPRGSFMFSHNYPWILQKLGYTIFKFESASAEPGNPENKNQLLSIIAYI